MTGNAFPWSCDCGAAYEVTPVLTASGGRSVRFRRADVGGAAPSTNCHRCHAGLLSTFKESNRRRADARRLERVALAEAGAL
jgi:hypothetical protein